MASDLCRLPQRSTHKWPHSSVCLLPAEVGSFVRMTGERSLSCSRMRGGRHGSPLCLCASCTLSGARASQVTVDISEFGANAVVAVPTVERLIRGAGIPTFVTELARVDGANGAKSMAHWGDLTLSQALSTARVFFDHHALLDETKAQRLFYSQMHSDLNQRGTAMNPVHCKFPITPDVAAAMVCYQSFEWEWGTKLYFPFGHSPVDQQLHFLQRLLGSRGFLVRAHARAARAGMPGGDHAPLSLPLTPCWPSVLQVNIKETTFYAVAMPATTEKKGHITWDVGTGMVELVVPVCLLEGSGVRKGGSVIIPKGEPGQRYSRATLAWVPCVDDEGKPTTDDPTQIRATFSFA